MSVELNKTNMGKSCKSCTNFKTCKYVEENKRFADSNFMFGMFEYLESNNIKDVFYNYVAPNCKFYLPSTEIKT